MNKSWLYWLADFAAGIAAAISLGLVVLLTVAWANDFRAHPILGTVITALAAFVILVSIRAVPYIRKKAEIRRQEEPEGSFADLLRDMKQARTEREIREKLARRRR